MEGQRELRNFFSINSKNSISDPFWGQNFFQKIRLSRTTTYGFLAPCQNLEKNNNQISRKWPKKWKYRQE